MKSKLTNFLVFFVIQVYSYAMIVFNYRMVAQGDYFKAIASDGVYSGVNWFVIRKIAKTEECYYGFAGYVTGCMVGSALGIYVSKIVTHG